MKNEKGKMKSEKVLTSILLTFSLLLFTCSAAVPLSWTVETTRAQPATFEAYQGETLTFEAALQAKGKPLEAPLNYSFFWQTNGMGSTYWEKEVEVGSRSRTEEFDNSTVGLRASTSTNVLFATWSPEMDVGAKVYNCFIGSPSNIYHAAFQLRLRPSPGATPNALPLPVPVIDFAKVRVLNPPWSGGGGGGVDTNAVIDIIHQTVDGEGRYLPPYLHFKEMDDTYPEAAAEWYAQADYSHGSCSARRSGNLLERNYDWNFSDMAEYVIRVPAGPGRFASLAVCNVGTNLTEEMVTSGKTLRWMKALPGHAVDGINSEGVCAEVNVVGGTWPRTTGAVHGLGAVRWALDHATNAQHAAEYLAANVYLPEGFGANFHYMIADATSTYIVENGTAYQRGSGVSPLVMTNFRLYPTRDTTGAGQERYDLLLSYACCITNAWYTRAYRRETNPPWVSDLAEVIAYTNDIFDAWASHPKEYFRGKTNNGQTWWQTLHTSVYDLTNRTLRIAVQETDDWYVFQVPVSGGGTDEAKVRAIASSVVAPVASSVSSLQSSKADKSELANKLDAEKVVDYRYASDEGYAADAKILNESIDAILYELSIAEASIADIDINKLPLKADASMISAADPTFSNEVATVARTVTPPPSPTLRLYDEVRQCWWLGKMVNGVMQWEVE